MGLKENNPDYFHKRLIEMIKAMDDDYICAFI